ncbi:MAG: hypothetical protein Q7U36_01625 [bacterium]|nr:hypothetical protein [bacterium]
MRLNGKRSLGRMSLRDLRLRNKIGKKSFGITLPIEDVRNLGWKERQKLSVKRIKRIKSQILQFFAYFSISWKYWE